MTILYWCLVFIFGMLVGNVMGCILLSYKIIDCDEEKWAKLKETVENSRHDWKELLDKNKN